MRCKDNTFSLENHRNSKQMLKNLKFQKKKKMIFMIKDLRIEGLAKND